MTFSTLTRLFGAQGSFINGLFFLFSVEWGPFHGIKHQGPVRDGDGPSRGDAQGLRQKGEDAREKGKTKSEN